MSFVVLIFANCIKSEPSGAAIKLKDLFYKSLKHAFFLLLLVMIFVVIYMHHIAYRSEVSQKILMLESEILELRLLTNTRVPAQTEGNTRDVSVFVNDSNWRALTLLVSAIVFGGRRMIFL